MKIVYVHLKFQVEIFPKDNITVSRILHDSLPGLAAFSIACFTASIAFVLLCLSVRNASSPATFTNSPVITGEGGTRRLSPMPTETLIAERIDIEPRIYTKGTGIVRFS